MIKRLFNALKQGIVLRMGYPPTAHREREEFILRLIKLLLKKASQVFEQGAVDEAVILYERAIVLTEQVLVSGSCPLKNVSILLINSIMGCQCFYYVFMKIGPMGALISPVYLLFVLTV